METTGDTHASAQHRPRPPRPDVVVAPLHSPGTDPGPAPRSLTVAITAWAASFAAFASLASALGLGFDTVVDALETSLSTRNPTADPTTVDLVAGLTVLGVGGVGVLLVLAAVLGIVRLRAGHARARVWLTVVGVLTVAAAVGSWSLLSDAGDISFRVLTWAPPLQAALVAAATALLFTPSISEWLGRRTTAAQ
ncbi:hypothetical protein ERC79_08195 [Rhodococcus sp. ABRD24]|uniref:hypothetical protein n=1 Tax=Rhodococcus sp. ABRD24 TaxID=2507582 RepID=UPI00103E459D|nr:hypothetical protein [Rhodococcus sp. ABRD24]QBJ95953.1 hypothetical protein ERC79_08195 [Rhodococcus sp. ABRD24]